MKTTRLLPALATLAFLALAAPAGEVPPEGNPPKLSGPYRHKNLTVFLIHGEDRIKDRRIITLQEAMQQGKVRVHETGNVQELAIENTSENEAVFVHSGDIVKGGKQDRVIAYDLVVAPRSDKVPINSFCVEQGRWRGRGNEAAGHFESSANQVAGKDLKLAAKLSGQQGEVWQKVAENQEKLSANVGERVQSGQSATSMQLSLENRKVKESVREYAEALAKSIEGKTDVVGFAFAVNGKVNSADVYASRELFRKLWPKLLESAAAEAVAEAKAGAATAEVAEKDVRACLADAEKGKGKEQAKEVAPRVRMFTRETEAGNCLFETRDERDKGEWLHRNYVRK
jgi:hypothetical protein